MLMAGNLYEPTIDQPDTGWIMPGATPVAGNVMIVAAGSNRDVTIGAATAVCRLLCDSGAACVMADADRSLDQKISDIRRAETTIHLGDSPLVYLSASLGIRTLCFRTQTWTKDTWLNYAHFPNVQSISVAGVGSPEEMAERIVLMIDSPQTPPAAKRNVEPIQPIFIPKLKRTRRARGEVDVSE